MKTIYTTKVKMPLYAGKKYHNIEQVGYTIIALYFDSAEKDQLIRQKEIKRIFTK